MTHPRSVAVSSLLGRAEYFLSAGRFSAQTDYGGWVWKHEACSIFLLPPPPSPQTSPIYNKEGKLSFNSQIQEYCYLTVCVCTLQTLSTLIHHPPAVMYPSQWILLVLECYHPLPVCGAAFQQQGTLQTEVKQETKLASDIQYIPVSQFKMDLCSSYTEII